jgi:hypothetical protein
VLLCLEKITSEEKEEMRNLKISIFNHIAIINLNNHANQFHLSFALYN